MDETIRTFIAIELDNALRRALGSVQAQLQRDRAARLVRWVEPASIHITLKFLGDVNAEHLPKLEHAIADACAGIPSFSLALAGLGAFPNTRRPNVIWVGANGQVDVAAQLAEKIDAACVALGFAPEERPFAPHLTLGRVKRDASIPERQLIGAMIDATQVETLGELKADHVSVMKSELRPSGSVYTRLHAVELKD
jgi:2'-5' RNA ligase